MFKRNDNADTGMSSFHSVEVEASIETLTRLFGAPGRGDGGYKTKHSWIFEGEKFNAEVYDYRFDGAREGHWHIGTENKAQAIVFARWLEAHLNEE